MSIALVTGSGGLIGSEAVRFCVTRFRQVIGIDNNMRKYFFGKDGSVDWNIRYLKSDLKNYQHFDVDIRDYQRLEKLVGKR